MNENFTNTLWTNDNLFVLYGMNNESVDLIYLDPPFNSKKIYSAPIGSKADGTSFKDIWIWQDVNENYLDKLVENYPFLVEFIKSIQTTHSKAMMAYITYMTQRIIELHRVLKKTGSFYLHCDPTASHYLKIVLDTIFGKNNFRNEIVWHYGRWTAKANCFQKQHDCILFYSKSKELYFKPIYKDHTLKSLEEYHFLELENNQIVTIKGKYNYQELIEMKGKVFRTLRRKDTKGTKKDRKYLDEVKGVRQSDTFLGIPYLSGNSKERTGYRTQKPLALLNRIIKASSKERDIVFDPFCGCATTCVAAQQLNRKWIGIDIETKATDLLIERLSDDAGLFSDFVHRIDVPQRTDLKIEPITKTIKERLFQKQKGKCNACDVEMRIIDFEVDHIIPKAKGGGDYYENYQLLCSNCNRVKGDRPMEYLRTKIKSREKLKNQISFGE